LSRFTIIGSGSWGTALSLVLYANGHEVCLWNRDVEVLENVERERINHKYLPGVPIPKRIKTEPNLEQAIVGSAGIIISVPSHTVRSVIEQIDKVDSNSVIISVVKGIENNTLLRVSEILKERFDEDKIVVLSGPSHAEEVANEIPTLVVCASKSMDTASWTQEAFMSSSFRVYRQQDVIGVEIGGALKNIIALAAGIIDGVGAGDNTKAALITRGLAEITRLGTKLGADSLTFAGLSGMGDLIVTCMSKYSRNRHLGEQIGKGKNLEEVLANMVMVAEGVKTTRSAYELAARHDVEIPIITEAYRVLFEKKDAKQAVYELMTRAAKNEDWG